MFQKKSRPRRKSPPAVWTSAHHWPWSAKRLFPVPRQRPSSGCSLETQQWVLTEAYLKINHLGQTKMNTAYEANQHKSEISCLLVTSHDHHYWIAIVEESKSSSPHVVVSYVQSQRFVGFWTNFPSWHRKNGLKTTCRLTIDACPPF